MNALHVNLIVLQMKSTAANGQRTPHSNRWLWQYMESGPCWLPAEHITFSPVPQNNLQNRRLIHIDLYSTPALPDDLLLRLLTYVLALKAFLTY